MSFSRYLQRAVLDHVAMNAAYTQPTSIHVALYTSNPGETNTGTEVSGTNYARVEHNDWSAASNASPSIVSNSTSVDFPTPGSGGWGTVTHFALFDAATDGNMLGYGPLAVSKVINEGDSVSFAHAALQVTLD